MIYKVYIDTDEEGNIVLPALSGTRVVPDKDYDYFFEVENLNLDIFPSGYKVVNEELVTRDAI